MAPPVAGAKEFWAKVKKSSKCWIWTGFKDSKGYGMVRRRAHALHYVQAHRYAWYLTHGYFPKKLVLHKCDCPNCVRPDHLWLGTHQDNMDDMWRKGRGRPGHVPGSKQGQSKLTEAKVIRIRALAEKGLRHEDIASKFGVCRSNIGIIVRRKGWTHV